MAYPVQGKRARSPAARPPWWLGGYHEIILWELILKHLTEQNSFSDSTANGRRQLGFAVVLILALCASALAGAWGYARFYAKSGGAAAHEQIMPVQSSHEAAYLRESLAVLADKVGALQAKIIAVDGLSLRVAEAAGVQYTEPELQANLPFAAGNADTADQQTDPAGDLNALDGNAELNDASISLGGFSATATPMAWGDPLAGHPSVMDFIEPADMLDMQDITAGALERRLDAMYQQVAAQEDGLALLDLMLTRRSGIEASLPTYSPVDYPYLSSSFGWRRNPVTGRHSMHEGLDFAAPSGTPIFAASSGVVTQARYRSGYGNLVEIMHGNGLSTRYAHASKLKVKEGEVVDRGQVIALVGSTGRSTGAHLHFEVRVAGHPLDPALFLPPQPSGQLIADAGDHLTATGTKVR